MIGLWLQAACICHVYAGDWRLRKALPQFQLTFISMFLIDLLIWKSFADISLFQNFFLEIIFQFEVKFGLYFSFQKV